MDQNAIDKENRSKIKKLLAVKRNAEYYKNTLESRLIHCETCNSDIDRYYFEKHCQTKRHQKLAEEGDMKGTIRCETCHMDLKKKNYKKHCETPRHLNWSKITL